MRTHSNAWFVTHEQHPDPRIWKFARAFRELGTNVSYFWAPVPLPTDLDGCLPIGLCERDVASTLVREPLNRLPEDLVQMLRHMSAAITAGGAFPATRRDRRNFGRLKKKIERLHHLATPDGLCFMLTLREGSDYYYCVDAGELWRLDDSYTPAERAVRLGLAELAEGLPDQAHLAFELARAIDSQIAAKRESLRWTVEKPSSWEAGFRYHFDIDTAQLKKVHLPPLYTRGPDSIGSTTIDFGDFKQRIYDYSQVLAVVQDHVARLPDGGSPDVIYVADLPTLPVGVLLKRRFPGSRLMIDCHEWWREQELIWNPGGDERVEAIDRWERLLYAECDVCITVGQDLASAMSRDLGSDFDAAYTCVFDVAPSRLGEAERNVFWSNRVGLPTGSKVALFQGSLTERRNLETLMRATKHLKENQWLVVVGDGPFRDEMVRIVEAEGNDKRTVFVGWVDQYDLINYTLAADLGIIPYIALSSYYGMSMPNKLAEYHACRLPILASSDLVEISRIVENDRVGMCIDMRDADLLGRTITSLLSNERALQTWGTNYRTAPEKFTFEAFKSRIVELTQGLL